MGIPQHLIRLRTYAAQTLNRPGLRDYIWPGVTPDLVISGPGIEKQPIAGEWLCHGVAQVRDMRTD